MTNKNYWIECEFEEELPLFLNKKFNSLLNKWHIVKDENSNLYYGCGHNPKSDLLMFAGSLLRFNPDLYQHLSKLEWNINSEALGLINEDMLSNFKNKYAHKYNF